MKTTPRLRFEFVGMLFALAIGEVALEVSKLLSCNLSIVDFYYSFSHLALATFIIAMSWIGWQSSKSLGNIVTFDSIFSIQFIILLIDIILVIIYFIIANGCEQYLSENKTIEKASADNETLWVMIIFAIYLIWDIITKSVMISFEKLNNGKYKRKYSVGISKLKERSIITIFCLALSIYYYLHYSNNILSNIQVFIVDINLLLIFILFRGWKQKLNLEYSLNESQIPDEIIKSSNIIFNNGNPITVMDSKSKLKTKIIIFRFFPLILMICLELINNFVL